MKNHIFSLILSTLFLVISISAQTFTSQLNGRNEIPANNSSAVGVGSILLNETETNVMVTLYFFGLNGTQTSARISNQTANVFTLPSGNFSQSFSVNSTQVADLKAGLWYFNISSSAFPTGEIRGQIKAISANNPINFPFSNGSLDSTFDTDGIITTPIGTGNDFAQAVAIQSDGKIVVAGSSRSANDDFIVSRYNPNGSLDTTFDGDGITITPIGTGDEQALAVIIQPDGKIIAAGQTSNGTNFDIAVVRYNVNGSLDTSFDSDGKAVTPIGSSNELVRTIALQNDGKIVVAGQTFNGANNDICLLRYESNGSLDATFDGNSGTGNGIITTAVGNGTDLGYGVAVQPDGKIIVAGYYFNVTNDAVVLRYDTNGVLDTSFDGDGIAITAVGTGTDEALSVALQSDGKIVIAGCINQNATPNDFLIVRYNADGSIDNTFGTNGATITPIGNASEIALGVSIQKDGKIVAIGFSNNGANNDFAVVRYNTNGTLDTSFDGDGKLTMPIGSGSDNSNGIAIQEDGKIVVVGRALIGANFDFAITRFGYGTNAQTNDGFFNLTSTTAVRFENATFSGGTSSTSINSLLLPSIPSGLNQITAPSVIQTTASFLGEIFVKFTLPNRVDLAYFNAAQIFHFENGLWINRTVETPQRDFTTRTIYAKVSSLSAFAIVSSLPQNPQNIQITGRLSSSNGRAIAKGIVTFVDNNGQTKYALTNPFGYYRFQNVLTGGTYTFNPTSKNGRFSPQIFNVLDETNDLNFSAFP